MKWRIALWMLAIALLYINGLFAATNAPSQPAKAQPASIVTTEG